MLYANICGNMFGIICGGGTTAMIGLANLLGAGDLEFGIINGIPQAAALMQIPFSILVNRTHHRKKYLLTFGLISRMMWIAFGFIPLVMPQTPAGLQLWTLIFLLGISSCCSGAINPCWFPWFSDLAPIGIRARWMSIRDMEVAAFNFGFGLLVAWMLETLPIENRYIIIFTLGGVIGMVDMVCFAFCEQRFTTPPVKAHFVNTVKDVFGNRKFMTFTLMWTAWCFTANLAGAYHSRYCMNVMGLSFIQIMLFVTMAASVGTILMVPRWGRIIGQIGCKNVMFIGCTGAALCHLFYLFSTPGNVWPSLLNNLIGAMFWSGSNLAANTMQLSCSPEENKSSYIAVFNCVAALVGTALGTVLGGALLDWWEREGWFTVGFDRYQVLTIIGTVLRLTAIFVFVPRLEDESHVKLSEVLRHHS